MAIEIEQPFPKFSLPAVWRWVQASRDRIADDFFAKDLDQFVDWWEEREARGRLSWAVKRSNQIGGVITAEKNGGISYDLHCVFHRDFYGHTTTVAALELVVDRLFAPPPEGYGAEKISTAAFADNLSLSGIVKALGGSREGTQHGQTRRGGRLVDIALLGLQKERFYELRLRRVGIVDGKPEHHVEPLQPERVAERNDEPGVDAGAAREPDAAHADHSRAGDEPATVPGASQEPSA